MSGSGGFSVSTPVMRASATSLPDVVAKLGDHHREGQLAAALAVLLVDALDPRQADQARAGARRRTVERRTPARRACRAPGSSPRAPTGSHLRRALARRTSSSRTWAGSVERRRRDRRDRSACTARANSRTLPRSITSSNGTPSAPTASRFTMLRSRVRSRVLAAHGHDLAGHVRGVVARQEYDHVRDLPGLRAASEGLTPRELARALVAGHLRQERVMREARRDRVHAHARSAQPRSPRSASAP